MNNTHAHEQRGSASLRDYIAIARPQQWWKNLLVLAGISLAQMPGGSLHANQSIAKIGLAMLAVCLLASSNYVLNEILDADGDCFHPGKQHRGLVSGRVSEHLAYLEWLLLGIVGLLMASTIHSTFLITGIAFIIAGLCYNVPPVRLKDVPVLDVLCEGLNSPLRVLMGWSICRPTSLPGIQLLLVFWMTGVFLMAFKRSRELKAFASLEQAASYRKSFAFYAGSRLQLIQIASLVLAFVCAFGVDLSYSLQS